MMSSINTIVLLAPESKWHFCSPSLKHGPPLPFGTLSPKPGQPRGTNIQQLSYVDVHARQSSGGPVLVGSDQ